MTSKISWRVIALLAGVLVTFGFWMLFLRNTPGQPSPTAAATEPRSQKTIVLAINDMRDPLSAVLARSIKRLINDNENLQAIVLDAGGLRSRQSEQLSQLDLSSIAGLILSPIAFSELDEPVGLLNQAGIPVVVINQAAGYELLLARQVTSICFDAVEAGRQQAEFCAGQLGGQGEIVILAGPEDQAVTRQMIQGVNEVLLKFPDLSIAEIEYGNWQRQSGKISMIRILQNHQNIDAVLALNDEMLLGALPLIMGQSSQLVKVGAGATTEGLEAISQGYIDASISINSQQMARMAFNAVIDAISGGGVRNEILQPQLISSDNLDTYIREIWNVN